MLKPVPLLGIGNVGKSVNVCAQQRVNLYAEIQPDPEAGSKITLYPTPGLTSFVDLGANPARGLYEKGDFIYVVNNLTLWEIAANGTTTNRGTLNPTTGRVDMADNGEELLIVDGTTTAYLYDFSTNAFTTVALPVELETCTFLNGRFIGQRTNSAEFYISDLYDGSTWDPLNFATSESDPDNLVRVIADNGMILLFGTKTTEFWGDSGGDDFPFARVGASAIEWGLASRWSLCKFMDSLIFLRKNRLGAVQVCVLAGSTAVPVSNPEMDYLFSTYTAENATAFAYMVSGHAMYQISFPSDNVTWTFDASSKEWHRMEYGTDGDRHRAEMQTNFQDRSYVSDWENGKIYLLDQDTYTDDGATIVREFTSRHLKTANYSRIPQLWIDMEAGVGLQIGQGSDPQVMLQISRDGGHTWGAEVWRSFGAIGQYTWRAVWNRLGRARDWTMRVRVTDPVKTVFVAAWGTLAK